MVKFLQLILFIVGLIILVALPFSMLKIGFTKKEMIGILSLSLSITVLIILLIQGLVG